MNFKKSLHSKENTKKILKINFSIMVIAIMMVFAFFAMSAKKVMATDYVVNGSSYYKNSSTLINIDKVDVTSNGYTISYIESNGEDSKVAIRFTITDFPSNATSFMVVESEYSDSSETADADRYAKDATGAWIASEANQERNDLIGSAVYDEETNSMYVTYRLRKGGFGIKFLKVFFHDASDVEIGDGQGYSLIDPIEVFYIVSQPVDLLDDNNPTTSCNEKQTNMICVKYVSTIATRESQILQLLFPETVAYQYKILDINDAIQTNDAGIAKYLDKSLNTIYGINYFKEENGTASVVENVMEANRSYLYMNFTKAGNDTHETGINLLNESHGIFMNYRDSYKINEIDYLQMKVDSTGSYFFYVTDVFGNVKAVKYNIENVKNRSIETKVTKGNAKEDESGNKITGYGAEENFTNESVWVSLEMTVKTNFEFGVCINNMCAEVTNLTNENVEYIKYWRVDVELDAQGNDIDAYYEGRDVQDTAYANENNIAADSNFYYVFCRGNCPNGATTQVYDDSNPTGLDNGGFSNFTSNILTTYIALSGRYRFYIKDIYGNDSWGTEGDLTIKEFRNPRVEIYAIDKQGPDITFDHEGTQAVNGSILSKFDIETYEYYQGLTLEQLESLNEEFNSLFVYDGRITDSVAKEGTIDEKIYYPVNRDDGVDGDKRFTKVLAILLSKVKAADNIYSYNGNKNAFATYATYDESYYMLTGYDNSINTILSNVTHNSNGLLNGDSFDFEVNYYHNDGVNKVCEVLSNIEGYSSYTNDLDCVNYYLDHGVDFIIEFKAKDAVGNEGSSRVYVNVVDNTPAGFTYNATNLVKSSNIGTKCRMEIGATIGNGKTQNKTSILDCYNVIVSENYNFEDNRYETSQNEGLSFYNRINNDNHVRVFMKNDNGSWINLEEDTFTPNDTGYYDLRIEIYDDEINGDNTNVLTVLMSYYVDKKIVLVKPLANDKDYGTSDPTFTYCVYIDRNNNYDVRFSDNPYSDPSIYSEVYCTNAQDTTEGQREVFQDNYNKSKFDGSLSRLESEWYNANLSTTLGATKNGAITDADGYGIENNYVGLYRIILGTLNIRKEINGEMQEDSNYIVKIHPSYRDNQKYQGSENDNLITNSKFEDDLPYTQSSIDFTIKQITLEVSANGGVKNYGEKDTNYSNYNDDSTSDKYLNGYTVTGVISGTRHYNDTESIVLGVLRRQVGENVGVYNICNYRGVSKEDNQLETSNNMYLNCLDEYSSGLTESYTYSNGIIDINEEYLKSRALYIVTNKVATGKTLNTTTDVRNNNYANYLIMYTNNVYTIKPIDLVLQAAPGQRREYNYTNTYDPNPWEIILYGLVDGTIKRNEDDNVFEGFTSNMLDGLYYNADPNEKDTPTGSEASKLEANASEERDIWNLVYNGKTLVGYKTNQTYNLLRSTVNGSSSGSAKLVRELGKDGGWYMYQSVATDLNVVTGLEDNNKSQIAVITNGKNNCSYDTSGHLIMNVGVDETSPCKNYNLVYNSYYTNENGYTYINQESGTQASDYIYVSNGKKCTELDPDLPCVNTGTDSTRIYKIQFEIYRREIILEFNSSIEVIAEVTGTNTDIVYGKRYNYYDTNYFTIGSNSLVGNNKQPEGYLFVCYQNDSTKAEYDPDNAVSGCTGDYRYGLTDGDSWYNIGLSFWMHDIVSNVNSGYYNDNDKAIPAGAYYIYSDISESQKKNYNFKYLGGALTIKSKSVDLNISSYEKEYGDKYYSKYGNSNDNSTYTAYENLCFNDGLLLVGNSELIVNENCLNLNNEVGNSYGFTINGLDVKDILSDNFTGRPNRLRSASSVEENNIDENALQDNVGIYIINKGTIQTKHNNSFKACETQVLKGTIDDCVRVSNVNINNYVLVEEERTYTFKMYTETITSEKNIIGDRNYEEGYLFIMPATIDIEVEANQKKMYGCAYNEFKTTTVDSIYSYTSGYSNCVEVDGNYYDLGYKYKVIGDKDYQIANNGYNYEGMSSYYVSGIYGSDTFRPSVINSGVKAHALNNGTLYRVLLSDYTGVNNYKFAELAAKAQLSENKTYQAQVAGRYIITLGNVDASMNNSYANMLNTCDVNNNPVIGGTYSCKNYNIKYYNTTIYNSEEADEEANQSYTDNGEIPDAIYFEVVSRKAYVYTDYDQKIYGDEDPNVSYACTSEDVTNGFCSETGVVVNYGLTRYYTKYNSLAKYPFSGQSRNDVQTDIVSGKISRKGMDENAPTRDDIKGLYEYVYDDSKYGATVSLTEYGNANYTINFYNAEGLAVNSNGLTQNDDEDQNPIKFEIVLRQIKIAFVSFDKVYGEHDDVNDYDILVCSPSEEFDFENMRCLNKSDGDKHGLSTTHTNKYLEEGILKQLLFKQDFYVRYIRVLGENVSCENSSNVNVTLNGYFYGSTDEVNAEGTIYTKTLKCNGELVDDKSVYETLAYIDQSDSSKIGYNYQVNYTIGYVNITPRPIMITPDAGQGFVYGDYHNTLIPAITYTDSLNTTEITQTYGLVNGGNSGNGICLRNINYYNNGDNSTKEAGTCFNINDRKDEYNTENSFSIGTYNSSLVNSNTGLSTLAVKNYIFGDAYTSENSTRSALNRGIGTNVNSRYNRNVGVYTINKGDLNDKSHNYTISFNTTITYEISKASVTVTPESTIYENTTQQNQYKIYGEQDKELTFKVTTKYTVKYDHYAMYNENIIKVCSSDNTCVENYLLDLYQFSETEGFVKVSSSGTHILLKAGDQVELNGFAYNENGTTSNLNYGVNKIASKKDTEESIDQSMITGSKYYDIACNNATVGCNADHTLSYGETSRILLGYLYVYEYSQNAGVYDIVNGMKVAANEFNNNNYNLAITENVKFTIIPRPVGVKAIDVTKTYGDATDIISCEYVDGSMISNCTPKNGVLHEDSENYLRYNFIIEYFGGSNKLESILGDNVSLYSQNGKYVNGLVPSNQSSYSGYSLAANTGESKNTNQLGVYLSRDEKNINGDSCLYDGDTYGFCEDVGEYALRFYGYANTIDNITLNGYNTVYKPTNAGYELGRYGDVSTYYYNGYFGYNPNYFVVVMDGEDALTSPFETGDIVSTDREGRLTKSTAKLTINKKDVKLYVNTAYFGEKAETYYIEQNTVAPVLPTLNNSYELDYSLFPTDRETAVGGSDTYETAVWGFHNASVRVKDKIAGELAYCNVILSSSEYEALLTNGITSDYTNCSSYIYNENKNTLNTNLVGYVPIVRESSKLSIVNATATSANVNYENTNYTVTFYPGSLRIEEDDTKPVVQVNRKDVYIEANAVGEYLFECVGSNKTTTYTDCEGLTIIGKDGNSLSDPILKLLENVNDSLLYKDGKNIDSKLILRLDLPIISGCDTREYECSASAYYELMYGKGKSGFVSSGGIVSGVENTFIEPFTMKKDEYINNSSISTVQQLIITLVDWFGVTSYDQGEYKNGQSLDKIFDQYWYLVIESDTEGDFKINKTGNYKIHFYVMDNAGNVSEGNMYEEDSEGNKVLQTSYNNVGTLHIIDTTSPTVGTLNLYNGQVKCNGSDCSKEDNWYVANDTYLSISSLLRYDADGNPSTDGEYVYVGDINGNVVKLSELPRYYKSKVIDEEGKTKIVYIEDAIFGRYILIPSGAKAKAIKHYSWSNSSTGIWMTITGGSDNSYTEVFGSNDNKDDHSQWNHYYSRDGGITWFLYDRTTTNGYLVLNAEGTREIMIKAVDEGIKITDSSESKVTYFVKYYGSSSPSNVTGEMTNYSFTDTKQYNDWLEHFVEIETPTDEEENTRYQYLNLVGWNMNGEVENDETMASNISKQIYGEDTDETGYEYYRDKQTAYLDITSPVISFGEGNGESIYVFEYGCSTISLCSKGYTEYYAGAQDSYHSSSLEVASDAYNINYSAFVNHSLYRGTSKYQETYKNVDESLKVNAESSGLGKDSHSMNGDNVGKDIRNIYDLDRKYYIYAFDEDGNRTIIDLSNDIPHSMDTEDQTYKNEEQSIYNIILNEIPHNYSKGDYSYTIVYSVIDKAGNESAHIARGVIFAKLIPDILVQSSTYQLNQTEENTYKMKVEQGDDVNEVLSSLSLSAKNAAGNKINYVTQTVYFNGELILDNERYDSNMNGKFSTNEKGIYEITYNLSYLYGDEDAGYEMLNATPVKLIIEVESTEPIATTTNKTTNYTSIIILVTVIVSLLFITILSFNKKRI